MQDLIKALIKFQKSVPSIVKNKVNPHYKSRYADLSIIIDTCMPRLNEHNLSVYQTFSIGVQNDNLLTTTLCHDSGQVISSTLVLPAIGDPQKLTSAITYLRRTQYISILGLCADDDDDGNFAIENKNQSYPQSAPTQAPKLNYDAVKNNNATEKQKGAVKAIKGKDFDVSRLSFQEASDIIKNSYNK